MIEKTRSRSRIPKVKKPPKKRKPLNNRRKFKAHDNPLKTYKRKYTDYQVTIQAEICRQARLSNRTIAESNLSIILQNVGCRWEEEKVFLNGDRFIIADFYIASRRIAIEADGSVHSRQISYDRGRDSWLEEKYKVKTIRFTNQEILKKPKEVEEKIRRLINETKP